MVKNGPIKNTKGGNLGFEAEFFKAAGQAPLRFGNGRNTFSTSSPTGSSNRNRGEIVVRGLRANPRVRP